MAIRKIVLMGNPILREVAAPVENVRADDIARLAEDMKETLLDIDSRGIAAPQVSVGQRVVVYRLPADHIPEGAKTEPVPWTAMVNSGDRAAVGQDPDDLGTLPLSSGSVWPGEAAPGHPNIVLDTRWDTGRAHCPWVPFDASAA